MGDPQAMECEGCPVRTLCYRLDAGRTYEVESVRDVRHTCELHDDGQVAVVEVAEVPFQASVPSKDLRGTATHWTAPACGMPECPRYGFCHPVGPVAGAKMEIVRVGESMECPAGLDLKEVTLKPME